MYNNQSIKLKFYLITLLTISTIPYVLANPLNDNSIDLSTLNGETGFSFIGGQELDFTGYTVDAGDINGDGLTDVIISADGSDITANSSGAAYVIFGKNTPFNFQYDINSLDGVTGFIIKGGSTGANLGWDVSIVGDVNSDGFNDILIGSPNEGNGITYVIYGDDTAFSSELDVTDLTGEAGFKIVNNISNEFVNLGYVNSSIGDFNNDSIDDFVISGRKISNNKHSVFVVFGLKSNFQPVLDVSELDGQNGFRVDGPWSNYFAPKTIADAGDFNFDGINDIIIGSYRNNSTHILFGNTENSFGSVFNVSDLNGTNGFTVNGAGPESSTGYSVAGIGDFNLDGIDDVLIGAPVFSNNQSGHSYVLFGKQGVFDPVLNLANLDSQSGFDIYSNLQNHEYLLGYSVSSAGDFNHDGYNDILVANNGRTVLDKDYYVLAYLIYGNRINDFDVPFSVESINKNTGIIIKTPIVPFPFFGLAMSSMEDINGDGINDIILGRQGATPNGNGSGAAYVLFGNNDLIYRNGFE